MDAIAPHALSAALGELALDLRWTWSHEADALWRRVDAEGWQRTQNPWTILQDISAERLRALCSDSSFLAELERLSHARREYLEEPGWFASAYDPAALSGIAYFSMGFGLGEALPLYAGGLGILVGDGMLPNPRLEKIIETYYSYAISSSTKISLDYQFIADPAYNADRGPVNVFSGRFHWQF